MRLINISKKEVRLSLTPPERQELNVEISGRRGLTVTSGSDCQLKVRFWPKDVRPLADLIKVKVTEGAGLRIPISCYMEPPLLNGISLL